MSHFSRIGASRGKRWTGPARGVAGTVAAASARGPVGMAGGLGRVMGNGARGVAPLIATRPGGPGWRWLVAALAVAGGLVASRPAVAATACGTLITNVAWADGSSGAPDFVPVSVSYIATATVVVLCPPVIKLTKQANWAMSDGIVGPYQVTSVGAVVTFAICVENQTTGSVWGVTLTDVLPAGMAFASVAPGYVPETDALWNAGNFYSPGAGALPTVSLAYVNGAVGPTMTAGAPADGTGTPLYLRWTLGYVGPKRSACVTYTARVL